MIQDKRKRVDFVSMNTGGNSATYNKKGVKLTIPPTEEKGFAKASPNFKEVEIHAKAGIDEETEAIARHQEKSLEEETSKQPDNGEEENGDDEDE